MSLQSECTDQLVIYILNPRTNFIIEKYPSLLKINGNSEITSKTNYKNVILTKTKLESNRKLLQLHFFPIRIRILKFLFLSRYFHKEIADRKKMTQLMITTRNMRF